MKAIFRQVYNPLPKHGMRRLDNDMELVCGHTLPKFGLRKVNGKKTVMDELWE